jgi:subtilisin family serine protease
VTVINLDKLNQPTLIQSVPLVGMTTAYGLSATGLGQAVAVIDTGVQSNHEFVSGKVVMEACFSNSGGSGGGVWLCPNGQSSQSGTGAADPTTAQCVNGANSLCYHGTHVAGIAAGNNTNPGGGKPANGVAKGADIVAVRVFTRFNDTTDCGGTAPCVLAFDSDLISALNWLAQNALNPAPGVSLASANMSLGGGLFTAACDSDAVKPSIDNLRAVGVATAVAARNNGSTNSISSPGCISSAIAVGSSDKQDVISSFTNMSSLVAIMAPGGFGGGSCTFGGNNPDILASVAGITLSANAGYACLAGTSMATPHVAGAFAAIRSACHTATRARAAR